MLGGAALALLGPSICLTVPSSGAAEMDQRSQVVLRVGHMGILPWPMDSLEEGMGV